MEVEKSMAKKDEKRIYGTFYGKPHMSSKKSKRGSEEVKPNKASNGGAVKKEVK